MFSECFEPWKLASTDLKNKHEPEPCTWGEDGQKDAFKERSQEYPDVRRLAIKKILFFGTLLMNCWCFFFRCLETFFRHCPFVSRGEEAKNGRKSESLVTRRFRILRAGNSQKDGLLTRVKLIFMHFFVLEIKERKEGNFDRKKVIGSQIYLPKSVLEVFIILETRELMYVTCN